MEEVRKKDVSSFNESFFSDPNKQQEKIQSLLRFDPATANDEQKKAFIEKAWIVFFAEKDLDIEVVKETKLLTITGSSRILREKSYFYHLKELKQSAFTRTIQLPDNLELEPEVSHLENGILKLAFKKIILKAKEPKETINKILIKKS